MLKFISFSFVGFILNLICVSSAISQNSPPTVSNVHVVQRAGTRLFDINFDVNDADGDILMIKVFISEDGGDSFLENLWYITGDISDIIPGTGKSIVWDAEKSYRFRNRFEKNLQLKVVAYDGKSYGTVTDIDGNVYKTVMIGNQEWMAENLRVTRYRNGKLIQYETQDTAWQNIFTGLYTAYEHNESFVEERGYLYNWYAVDDSSNIAPEGWHVPSDGEWKELEMYIGMSQNEVDSVDWRGIDEGSKLKEIGYDHWSGNADATNEYGFTALPGGYLRYGGGFFSFRSAAYFWTSTNSHSYYEAWSRSLSNNQSIRRRVIDKTLGYSIRCVKDR